MHNMKVFFILLLFLTRLFPNTAAAPRNRPFDAIYQFGDSISDTGNLIREVGAAGCGRLPYGEATFGYPTGRCSDGLLMIDFLAQYFDLPYLSAYLDRNGDFTHGANFAVAGATALDTSALAVRGIYAPGTRSSLNVQLDWFRSHLNSICSNPSECKEMLGRALFLVGEIGGNDYNAAALQRRPIQELYNLVPDVVQTIMNAVETVIDYGAKRIIVPGNFPVGCMTIYLSEFRTTDPNKYDELGCLKDWNEMASYHNNQLKHSIKNLQAKHRDVTIVYADYYSAMREMLARASELGFDQRGVHQACCGTGDRVYNFDSSRMCGQPWVPSCLNPSTRVSWDGIHLTQHAYQLMAEWLLHNNIAPSMTA